MKVMNYILEKLKSEKMHMTLIDPAKQDPEKAGEIAYEAYTAGTDAIMIGGSTDLHIENVDKSVLEIKDRVDLPVILFPSGAHVISKYADAIYFMSLLNSRNPEFLIRQQVIGAPIVKKLGIEPIPMGYIIVEPGMTVGRVGEADLISRDKPEDAAAYALAAQYLGMKLVYLEAGSGAPEPVPPEMIRIVKSSIDIPLIVGGGIREYEKARNIAKAGADIIVTGTLVERVENIKEAVRKIVEAIKF